MTDCEHKFVYGGIRYKVSEKSRRGSDAHDRYYFDWYFCERCLESKYARLDYQDYTYLPVALNALPMRSGERP